MSEQSDASTAHHLGIARPFSRRSFVVAAAGAGGLAALQLDVAAAAVRTVAGTGHLSKLHLKNFKALKGHRFSVRTVGNRSALTLTKVQSEVAGPSNAAECFSLTFRHLSGPVLPQGTFRFHTPSLGAFQLFIVPGATNLATQTYTAIVNRI